MVGCEDDDGDVADCIELNTEPELLVVVSVAILASCSVRCSRSNNLRRGSPNGRKIAGV